MGLTRARGVAGSAAQTRTPWRPRPGWGARGRNEGVGVPAAQAERNNCLGLFPRTSGVSPGFS
eukprot:762723-Hanusia_phi.AAC.18